MALCHQIYYKRAGKVATQFVRIEKGEVCRALFHGGGSEHGGCRGRSMQHHALAFLDALNGTMVIPSIHMVVAHVRNLSQFREGIKAQRDLLMGILGFMDMQEKQIDNWLAFWEPIIADMEHQAEQHGKEPGKN